MLRAGDFDQERTWRHRIMQVPEPRPHEDTAAPRLNVGAKLTAVMLLVEYRNSKSGMAYPALSTFANVRGASERTVRRHLEELECAGFIRRADDVRQGRPVRWLFTFPDAADTAHQVSGEPVTTGQPVGTGDPSSDTQTSELGSPEFGHLSVRTSDEPDSVKFGHPDVRHLGHPGVHQLPTTTERSSVVQEGTHQSSASAPVPGPLARPGLGLRLRDVRRRGDGHAYALLDADDGVPTEPTALAVWQAVSDSHDPECSATGCAAWSRYRTGGFVVARASEDVDGLVAALRAAGVDVDTVAA